MFAPSSVQRFSSPLDLNDDADTPLSNWTLATTTLDEEDSDHSVSSSINQPASPDVSNANRRGSISSPILSYNQSMNQFNGRRHSLAFLNSQLLTVYRLQSMKITELNPTLLQAFQLDTCPVCLTTDELSNNPSNDVSPNEPADMTVLTCTSHGCQHVLHTGCLSSPLASLLIIPHRATVYQQPQSLHRYTPSLLNNQSSKQSIRTGCTFDIRIVHSLTDRVVTRWSSMTSSSIDALYQQGQQVDLLEIYNQSKAPPVNQTINQSTDPLALVFPFSHGRMLFQCSSPSTKEDWSIRAEFDLSVCVNQSLNQTNVDGPEFEFTYLSNGATLTVVLKQIRPSDQTISQSNNASDAKKTVSGPHYWQITQIKLTVPAVNNPSNSPSTPVPASFGSPAASQSMNQFPRGGSNELGYLSIGQFNNSLPEQQFGHSQSRSISSNTNQSLHPSAIHGSDSNGYLSSGFTSPGLNQSIHQSLSPPPTHDYISNNQSNNQSNNHQSMTQFRSFMSTLNGEDLDQSTNQSITPFQRTVSAPVSQAMSPRLNGFGSINQGNQSLGMLSSSARNSLISQSNQPGVTSPLPQAMMPTRSSSLLSAESLNQAMNKSLNQPMNQANKNSMMDPGLVTWAKSQAGSRLLQQQLATCDSARLTEIFDALKEYLHSLSMDLFGNYCVQKLIAHASAEQRADICRRLLGGFGTIASDRQGTRVIQKLVETISTTAEFESIVAILTAPYPSNNAPYGSLSQTLNQPNLPLLVHLSRDVNGTHAVAAAIASFPPRHSQPLAELAFAHLPILAVDQHGICVLKRGMTASINQSYFLTLAVHTVSFLHDLINHQFGNYLISHLLEVQTLAISELILSKLSGHFVELSKQKYSSNVIERCLRVEPASLRETIVEEFLSNPLDLLSLFASSYGNYVLMAMAQYAANEQQLQRFIKQFNMPVISHALRKPVRAKWDKFFEIYLQTGRWNCEELQNSQNFASSQPSNQGMYQSNFGSGNGLNQSINQSMSTFGNQMYDRDRDREQSHHQSNNQSNNHHAFQSNHHHTQHQQSVNPTMFDNRNHSVNQSMNQSINQTMHQSINQSLNQSMNQSMNQPLKQQNQNNRKR